jgi:polyisoprenyl-teichoic acid--peptidoglycan teichoic acid transferase
VNRIAGALRPPGPARRPLAWGGAALAVALAVGVVAAPPPGDGLAVAATASPSVSPSPSPSGPALEIEAAHSASFVPALQRKGPLFILALGGDARAGLGGNRADSIHLIGLDPGHRRATILGFPRDSWVPIPGVGTNKINTAMSFGGPALMVRTVENLTGIHIDYWMTTSFAGLTNMVNGIGGLDVQVTQPMHDHFSGANFNPGLRHLNGTQALAFARDRHDFSRGDIQRSANQGRLMLSALSKLTQSFRKDPSALFTYLTVGWRNVQTSLSVATLLDLGLTATQISRSKVNNIVVRSRSGSVGSLSVVFIDSSASGVYRDLRNDGYVEHPSG